jgi:peptidoglycan/xylan/chitin deacetylase (PgdA/CDA1 family)
MPWKQGYTISDEIGMPDDEVHWPDGQRCCMRIVVDLGLADSAEGLTPKNLRSPEAVFTMGEGLDVVLAMLEKHAMRATFAVPAMMAATYAHRVRALHEAGHEIAVNGLKHEDMTQLSREEKARRIAWATDMVSEVTGQRPTGWFGMPRVNDAFAVGTASSPLIDMLVDAGYRYFGNGLADDIPHYWVSDFARRRVLLTLPSYYHFNDQYFMLYPRRGSGLENPDVLMRNLRWEFDAQYTRGRHFEMTLHPQHVAWSDRMPGLARFLAHAASRPDVWNATSDECARHWLAHYPADKTLHLEPSVWRDHEGSLS